MNHSSLALVLWATSLATGFLAESCPAAQESADADRRDRELVAMVAGLLNDPDPEMSAIGLEQVRNGLKSPTATRQLLDILPALNPTAQTGLIRALADREDPLVAAALLSTVRDVTRSSGARAAAVHAVGMGGDASSLPLLLELLDDPLPELRSAARFGLARLKGSGIPPRLATAMLRAGPENRVVLIGVLLERRAVETIPELLLMACGEEAAVRTAAMEALSGLGRPEDLSGICCGILRAAPGREREAAERALITVCRRIADAELRPAQLLAVVEGFSPADRLELLPALGRIGGEAPLAFIERSIASPDPREHGLGVRALCNWPDAGTARRLMELSESEPRPELRGLALKALIRVSALPDGRTESEKLALLKSAMERCSRDSERILVLQRAPAIRSIETLRYLLTFFDSAPLAIHAHQAVVELAHDRTLREPHQAEFGAALDRVLAASEDAVVLDRARRYKSGQTWDRKLAVPPGSEQPVPGSGD